MIRLSSQQIIEKVLEFQSYFLTNENCLLQTIPELTIELRKIMFNDELLYLQSQYQQANDPRLLNIIEVAIIQNLNEHYINYDIFNKYSNFFEQFDNVER